MTANTHGVAGSLRAEDGVGTVHLECHIDAPVNEVWSALTDRARLARWLGELDGDLRVGSELNARFHATGWEGTCHIDTCDPGSRLLVQTRSEGEPDCEIELTLAPAGSQTLLIVEDRGLPLAQLAAYGAGDQVLVEDLHAHLAGGDRCDAMSRWRELHPDYSERAAALA